MKRHGSPLGGHGGRPKPCSGPKAEPTDWRFRCPFAPGPENNYQESKRCKSTTAYKSIEKVNEHLNRVHSSSYVCIHCEEATYSIVSKSALKILKEAHEAECKMLGRSTAGCDGKADDVDDDDDDKHDDDDGNDNDEDNDNARNKGKCADKGTAVRMTEEQEKRWKEWRKMIVPLVLDERKSKTSWRRIYKCFHPNAKTFPAMFVKGEPKAEPSPDAVDVVDKANDTAHSTQEGPSIVQQNNGNHLRTRSALNAYIAQIPLPFRAPQINQAHVAAGMNNFRSDRNELSVCAAWNADLGHRGEQQHYSLTIDNPPSLTMSDTTNSMSDATNTTVPAPPAPETPFQTGQLHVSSHYRDFAPQPQEMSVDGSNFTGLQPVAATTMGTALQGDQSPGYLDVAPHAGDSATFTKASVDFMHMGNGTDHATQYMREPEADEQDGEQDGEQIMLPGGHGGWYYYDEHDESYH